MIKKSITPISYLFITLVLDAINIFVVSLNKASGIIIPYINMLATLEPNDLYNNLTNKLEELKLCNENILTLCKSSIEVIIDSIKALRLYVSEHPFKTNEEEIKFFKEIKPKFYSHYLYFITVYRIELQKPIGSSEIIQHYLLKQLNKLRQSFQDNSIFYAYYRNKSTFLDHEYFIREPNKQI